VILALVQCMMLYYVVLFEAAVAAAAAVRVGVLIISLKPCIYVVFEYRYMGLGASNMNDILI
jgi:hypothetical protein